MSEKRDYYEILEVDKSADAKQLKQAFRSLARRYHPDKNDADDAEARFKEIQEAYAVLSDSDKRQQYDRFGHNPPGGSPFGAGGFSGFNINLDDILGGDFFSSFFGGSRRSANNGNDILLRHTITLEQAFTGVKEQIDIDLPSKCSDCSGTGAQGGKTSTCKPCSGQGRVRVRQQVGPFVQDVVRTCDSCSGLGSTADSRCRECAGNGIVEKEQSLNVTIPEGADQGMRLRIRGKGQPGKYGRGQPGDLFIEIQLEDHPWFERSDRDLIMSLPLGYSDLVLGCEFEIPHIDGGILNITVPKSSNSGDTITISGKGMPDSRGRIRGDVIVLLKLDMPRKFNKSVRKALEDLRQELLSESDVIVRMKADADERRRS
jgi:molecular chaperone DnaJ